MTRIGTLDVLPICLGGNVFGWTADEAATFAVLDAFTEGGGSFVDTSDSYFQTAPGNSGGESETLIGNWLRARGPQSRDRLVVATKVGKWNARLGLDRANVRAALDDSRRRLGIDVVDLYYAHQDDPDQTPGDIVATVGELVREGAVRNWALSNFSRERFEAVCTVASRGEYAPPAALQPDYSLVHRGEVEATGLGAAAIAHDVALVPYYALASGFLTGKYRRGDRPDGARAPRVKAYLTDDGFRVIDELDAVAQEVGASPAAVAAAWLRYQPGVAAPIASASRAEQVPDLLESARLQLSPEQVARLTKASEPFVEAGR
jgi:aryl-alcohol dehydrogenase-like predicted oxidoreductase